MSTRLEFTVIGIEGSRALTFDADRLVCCGWAGRDRRAVDAHVDELAALGVARPTRIPTYMNFATYLLTHDAEMGVVSDTSSGEIEYVLLCRGDRLWVSVGSDQTDRDIETTSIPASKQMCAKDVAATCWPYEDVANHWDDLILRCWVSHDGKRSLYQDGTLASILPPLELIERIPDVALPTAEGIAIFSGTIATRSGLVYGDGYEVELEDPVLKRRITGAYRVSILSQYL